MAEFQSNLRRNNSHLDSLPTIRVTAFFSFVLLDAWRLGWAQTTFATNSSLGDEFVNVPKLGLFSEPILTGILSSLMIVLVVSWWPSSKTYWLLHRWDVWCLKPSARSCRWSSIMIDQHSATTGYWSIPNEWTVNGILNEFDSDSLLIRCLKRHSVYDRHSNVLVWSSIGHETRRAIFPRQRHDADQALGLEKLGVVS